MTTARLRKAFRYPSESDSEEPVEGIDEEGTRSAPLRQDLAEDLCRTRQGY